MRALLRLSQQFLVRELSDGTMGVLPVEVDSPGAFIVALAKPHSRDARAGVDPSSPKESGVHIADASISHGLR